MTSALLLENFEKLAEAPTGIPTLREMILQLAIRGQLVPQREAEHPVTDELREIRTRKGEYVKARIRGGVKVPRCVPSEDEWFALPDGWEWARVDDSGDYFNGLAFKASDWSDEGTRIVRIQNLSDPSAEFNRAKGPFPADRKASDGDILVSWSATLDAFLWDRGDVVVNQHIFKVIPEETVLDRVFLYHLLRVVIRRMAESEHAHGLAMKHINRGPFLSHPVGLPPLAEQKRIVAKVDELMALCDDLEAKQQAKRTKQAALNRASLQALTEPNGASLTAAWHRVRDHFDALYTVPETVAELRQTILQLAVMGRLVPQDPNDEPASELLKKIQAERQRLITEGAIRRPKPLPPIDLEEVPFKLPSGWVWARFPELGEFGRGKSKHRPRNDPTLYREGTHPLVQTGDVARANGLIATYTGLYNDEGLAQSRLWPKGTMCITIAANIADSAILGFDACFPDSVVGFIPARCLGNTRYFDYFMRTAKGSLLEFAPSTAQKNINLAILNSVLIPIPPRAELERIAAKVDQLMTLCDNLESKLQRAQTDADNLLAAVVHELVGSESSEGGSS